jgi:hypothetical protein
MKLLTTAGNPLAVKVVAAAAATGTDVSVQCTGMGTNDRTTMNANVVVGMRLTAVCGLIYAFEYFCLQMLRPMHSSKSSSCC